MLTNIANIIISPIEEENPPRESEAIWSTLSVIQPNILYKEKTA